MCENGESFYLEGQTPIPAVDSSFKANSDELNSLSEELKKTKSEKLLWKIWKIKSNNNY